MLITRDKKFYRTVIALAIPMILQNLITYSVGLADNIMIGSLGDSAVSGVYMAGQVQTVLQVLSAGIEGGILVLASQYWGKKDCESIQRIVSIGIWLSLALGVVFTAVCAAAPGGVVSAFTPESTVIASGRQYMEIICWSYIFFCITQALIISMRSVESAKIGLAVSVCSLFIDVALNYLLIFGKLGFPEMGIRGAALATLIARICESLIMVLYVRFADKKLRYRFSMLKKLDRALVRDFLHYGMPVIAGQLVWGANLLGSNIIVGHFFGESVITAVSIAGNLYNFMYVGMNGISGAVGIVIGKTVGSGDVSRIKEYSRTVQLASVLLGIFTCAVFALARDPFISFYDITESAAGYSRQFINVLCVTCLGTCYQYTCLFGLVKSGGDVGFVFKNDTVFVFGVVLPSALITALLGCPAWIVWACLKCDQILKGIVAFFKIRKYNWMKNLTRTDAAEPLPDAAKT